MKYTYEQLAKMIDHSLLHPTLTDQELEDGCKIAAQYGVASVCIKPYAVQRVAELLRGSGVNVGAGVGRRPSKPAAPWKGDPPPLVRAAIEPTPP